MMSSMEILTRLGDVPFRTNVFQLAGFTAPDPSDLFGDCPDCDQDHAVSSIEGSAGDSFTSGIFVDLDYSSFPVLDFGGVFPDVGRT